MLGLVMIMVKLNKEYTIEEIVSGKALLAYLEQRGMGDDNNTM